MATVALLGTVTWNTTAGSKTVTATPAVGDQLFLVTAHSGNVATTAPTDNNPDGLGAYTLVASALKNASADILCVYRRNALVGNASSTVFTHNPGTTTGGGLGVIQVQGIPTAGASVVIRSGTAANQASGTTPTVTLAAASSPSSVMLGAVFSTTNGVSVTERTGYTEQFDGGYNTPASGLEIITRASGETASSIAWGSTVPSAYSAVVVEINAPAVGSAAGTGAATGVATNVAWSTTASNADYTFSNNQLTATKAANSANGSQAQADVAHASGYFEVKGAVNPPAVGLVPSGAANNNWVGFVANSIGYHESGTVYRNNVAFATYATFTGTDTVMCCLKLVSTTLYAFFGVNGVWQSGTDPSAGTGGIDVTALFSSAVPAISANNVSDVETGNFTASLLTYSVPTGVTAWDGTSVAAGTAVGSAAGAGSATGVGASVALVAGSSSGTGAATGVGSAQTNASGASAGTGAASAAPIVSGAAAGTGAASAVGASVANGVGSSAGTGTASGVGQSQALAVGAAAGIGVAAAVGGSLTAGIGSAAGTGAASGVGSSLAKGVGSASGTGAAAGAAVTGSSIGSASGTGAATAAGQSVALSTGAAAGSGAGTGVGSAQTSGQGSAAGIGAASAAGSSLARSAGASAATGAVNGVGASTANAVGSAVGIGAANANGTGLFIAGGSASGTSTASAQGAAYSTGVGLSAGFGVAVGAGRSIAEAIGFSSAVGAAMGIVQFIATNAPTPLSRRIVSSASSDRSITRSLPSSRTLQGRSSRLSDRGKVS